MPGSSTQQTIRRTSNPSPVLSENGMITVSFGLNAQPDLDWKRLFENRKSESLDTRLPQQLHFMPREQSNHPGRIPARARIAFCIDTGEQLEGAIKGVDELIAQTNEDFTNIVVPQRQTAEQEAARRQAEHEAQQMELNKIAAGLAPPEGADEPEEFRGSLRTSRDW